MVFDTIFDVGVISNPALDKFSSLELSFIAPAIARQALYWIDSIFDGMMHWTLCRKECLRSRDRGE